jgi:hypothetical protein
MYSIAYDPRTAAALAQEHIERQLGITAAAPDHAHRAPSDDLRHEALGQGFLTASQLRWDT